MRDRGDRPPPGGPFQWNTFLNTPPDEARFETAEFVVLSVPFDGTTSYMSGARHGPSAIIAASSHLEDYDVELERDISEAGIHTAPELVPDLGSPQALVQQVECLVDWVAASDKTPVLLGGDHSVTIGAVWALVRRLPQISVLYLDAHGDLRDEYMGTRWGHASTARRLTERCRVVPVGTRSLCLEERMFIEEADLPAHFWPPRVPFERYVASVVDALGPDVYVSVDLDVFDPSIMSAVGAPEPGGMQWEQVTGLLRKVGQQRRIVGFDIVELSPDEGPEACAYTAAKLAYKLMGYASSSSQSWPRAKIT
jgi:agmatinase